MVIHESVVAEVPGGATSGGAPLVAVDQNFETRWAAWVARGQVHDRRVRRRFLVSAVVIAIAGAIAFAFLV